MANIFISYSRKDIEFAKRLTGELQKNDLDFWIDWEGIPPTVDWWKEIEKGIGAWLAISIWHLSISKKLQNETVSSLYGHGIIQTCDG
jgi:hypothetical protein